MYVQSVKGKLIPASPIPIACVRGLSDSHLKVRVRLGWLEWVEGTMSETDY